MQTYATVMFFKDRISGMSSVSPLRYTRFALGAVAETSTAHPAGSLWNRRERRALSGHAAACRSGRFRLTLWIAGVHRHAYILQTRKLVFIADHHSFGIATSKVVNQWTAGTVLFSH